MFFFGFFVDFRDYNGKILLMMVVLEDKKEVVNFFLDYGVNFFLEDNWKRSLIYYVVKGGNIIMINMMFFKGFVVNLRKNWGKVLFIFVVGNDK